MSVETAIGTEARSHNVVSTEQPKLLMFQDNIISKLDQYVSGLIQQRQTLEEADKTQYSTVGKKHLQGGLRSIEKTIKEAHRLKALYRQLFAMGCEPACFPKDQNIGVLEKYKRLIIGSDPGFIDSAWLPIRWGCVANCEYWWQVYVGPIPEWVYKKYEQAKRLLGRNSIVIVSPNSNDFVKLTDLCKVISFSSVGDPQMFGYVGKRYLEWVRIAAWDLKRDLTALRRKR